MEERSVNLLLVAARSGSKPDSSRFDSDRREVRGRLGEHLRLAEALWRPLKVIDRTIKNNQQQGERDDGKRALSRLKLATLIPHLLWSMGGCPGG